MATNTVTTITDIDGDLVHVKTMGTIGGAPLVCVEVAIPSGKFRAAYLTPAQARALAGALHVHAYGATVAAREASAVPGA